MKHSLLWGPAVDEGRGSLPVPTRRVARPGPRPCVRSRIAGRALSFPGGPFLNLRALSFPFSGGPVLFVLNLPFRAGLILPRRALSFHDTLSFPGLCVPGAAGLTREPGRADPCSYPAPEVREGWIAKGP
jgi:hypothetical protein